MWLQEAPADTLNFMFYGYGVILGAIALFIVSLAVRFRNLRRDLALLQEMEEETGA